jgi:hypothetical protein
MLHDAADQYRTRVVGDHVHVEPYLFHDSARPVHDHHAPVHVNHRAGFKHFNDNPTATGHDYDIKPTRSGLVGAIRTGEYNQSGHAAALFLALIAELERERYEATSEEGKPPTMEELFALKDAFNRTRSHRHGGKLA